MKKILIVGSGDVALRAIPLLTRRYRVFALVRNPAYCARLRSISVEPILGDLDDRASLVRIAGIADAVLHFAPPPSAPPLALPLKRVPGGWGGQKGLGREQGKLESPDTRTRNLLAALSRSTLPKRLVYISTSGVYGDCGGAWVSETHPLNSTSPRSRRRLDAEMQIRKWAKRNQVNASILRVPGIYAADRLPLSRLQQGTPAIIDSEDSYTNHIHADDLASISVVALRYGKPCRIYHTSDDSHLKMGEYLDGVADAFGLLRVPRISRAEAQHVLSEMLLSFMNESRRLTNQRMKRELKVKLRYPTVADMLAEVKT
ncbi:MAG: SDR family oxidoreductase [Gallionella sp.]